jgi:hypothetical protein
MMTAIKVLSEAQFDSEIKAIALVLGEKETEDTWLKIEKAVSRLTTITAGSANLPQFINNIKRFKSVLISCVSYKVIF